MVKGFFVYEFPPIDWFEGSLTLEQFVKEHVGTEDVTSVISVTAKIMEDIVSPRLSAIAEHTHWEGDMREPMRFIGLPNPDYGNLELALLIKQDNNGTTFLASPFELPWLAEYCCYRPKSR